MLYFYLLLGALVLLSYSSPTDRLAGEKTPTGGDVLVALVAWFVVLPVWPLAVAWRACTALYDWALATRQPRMPGV